MKKLYLSITALFCFVFVQCQVINTGEYFFDVDPGFGNGTPISVTSNDTISLSNLAISTSNLSVGYHFLYVRVKENNGTWSHCRRQRLYVFDNSPIVPVNDSVVLTQAEYWIDSVPVPGTGRLISLPAKDTFYYNESILGLQLDSGSHKVSIRVKDSEGNWSFVKTDDVRIEYYDLFINIENRPFTRPGNKEKYKITFGNRQNKNVYDLFLTIKINHADSIIIQGVADSVGGLSVKNTPIQLTLDGNTVIPIWIYSIPAYSERTFDLYLKSSAAGSHEIIKNSFELWYNKLDDNENEFNKTGLLYNINASLAFSAIYELPYYLDSFLLLNKIDSSFYDSLYTWYKRNISTNNLLPLSHLVKSSLTRFGGLSDSLITQFTSKATSIILKKSFLAEENPPNNGSFFLKNSRSKNSSTLEDCPPPCAASTCESALPPFAGIDKFEVLSEYCAIRCRKQPDGTYAEKPEHRGWDIVPKRSARGQKFDNPTDRSDWEGCNYPVYAMFSGDIIPTNYDSEGGLNVKIKSCVGTPNEFTTTYNHLCEKIPIRGIIGIGQGQIIGYAGNTGPRGTPFHLDIKFDKTGSNRQNPECYIAGVIDKSSAGPSPRNQDVHCVTCIDCDGKSYTAKKCPSNKNCPTHENINSFDPNDKVGNEGYTPQHYIKSTDELHYGIFFENVDTATAAAQVVTILDTLDLTKVDKHSFYLESMTAGEMLVVLSDSIKLQNLDSLYKEKPVNGTYVRIQATFDTTTGILKYILTSIDTTTLLPDSNVLHGFLPPDTSKFHGNGLVSYKIKPLVNIPGGTVISNKAHIIFDNNDAIVTGTWFNTIDGSKPSSRVSDLPSISYDSSFTVRWKGIDNESGIVAYDVYYKTSGESIYKKWINYTADTSAIFTGNYDSTYQFYSIAYDSVLNEEDIPVIFDAVTIIKKPLEDSLCNGGNISFNSGSPVGITSYQWQVDNGLGFSNLNNGGIYSGATNDTLKLIAVPSSNYGNMYRCVVNKSGVFDTSIVHVIRFANKWVGDTSTAWENPVNWSCNVIPDGNTDVIVAGNPPNAPEISSDAICRSLALRPDIPFKVNPNFTLIITH